jgi:hypothetical protein
MSIISIFCLGLAILASIILLAIIADRGTPNFLESLGFLWGQWCDHSKRLMQRACFGLADRMRERRLEIELKNRNVREGL